LLPRSSDQQSSQLEHYFNIYNCFNFFAVARQKGDALIFEVLEDEDQRVIIAGFDEIGV
jgi:hypothetical protein